MAWIFEPQWLLIDVVIIVVLFVVVIVLAVAVVICAMAPRSLGPILWPEPWLTQGLGRGLLVVLLLLFLLLLCMCVKIANEAIIQVCAGSGVQHA